MAKSKVARPREIFESVNYNGTIIELSQTNRGKYRAVTKQFDIARYTSLDDIIARAKKRINKESCYMYYI